jgi:acetoin utilization deacetylase AcuC-like enzyme
MKIFYADNFVLPLPDGHRFPMAKYRLLRQAVEQFEDVCLEEAPEASLEDLLLAHDQDYVNRVINGQLTPSEQREIGFPWSPQMVERSRRSAGATIAACRTAWSEGVAANLAGGTHHAYANKGSGFCVFNDGAIAARASQKFLMPVFGRKARVAIIDLDVHQGNGTASILQGDDSVFTLSLHGEKNFPFRKEKSDLDIGLADGVGDEAYLYALERAILEMTQLFDPELIIYLAGADPHEGDRLGRLSLSFEGLKRRDLAVLNFASNQKIPLAITMAGGYGNRIEDTVQVHAQTIKTAIGYAWI